jgi:hypothetical protein
MIGNYKVITLCGSTRFKEAFMEETKRLTLEGNIVISVGCFGHSGDDEVWTTDTKAMLDDMHKRKIDMADEIFVINKDGYIGASTRSEIMYAESMGKKVRYLEPSALDKVIQNKINGICDDCDQDATMCYLKGSCTYAVKYMKRGYTK